MVFPSFRLRRAWNVIAWRTRREVLVAAAVAAGLAGCAGSDEPEIERLDVRSRILGRSLEQIGVRTGEGRPLLVLLHGRGSKPADVLALGLQEALQALGARAPSVLLVNGGDDSYYHDRRGGRWGSYVLREAIPAGISRLDADGTRVAIGGISMGGFGALDLARLAPRRFCAVGGHSAALWRGETPPGAFGDAADFRRHDLLAAASRGRPYRSAVWIDVGTRDPFARAGRRLARLLSDRGVQVTYRSWPGSHEPRYWRAHLPAYLGFYARALGSCR